MKFLSTLILLASFCFGQYTFTTIEEFEFDVSRGHYARVAAMNDSIFVVLYTGGNNHGTILKTYEVDSDYTNITLVDSIQVDAGYAAQNEIIKIDSDLVLIAYLDGAAKKLATFSFDGNWDITLVDTHTLTEAGTVGWDLVLAPVTDTQAVFTSGIANTLGYIHSVHWDSGTGANIAEDDYIWFDNPADNVSDNRIIAVNDSIYIIAFHGDNADPFVNSFNIGDAFDNVRDIDELVLFTSADFVDIASISSTHAIVQYTNVAHNISYFETISWDVGAGTNLTEVDGLIETTMNPGFQLWGGEFLQYPGGGDYIMWREYNSKWNVRSYAVDGAYAITDNGDSTQFSAITPQTTIWGGVSGDLLDSSTGTYVIIYSEETSFDGYLQTMTVGGSGWAHSVSGVASPSAVNYTTGFTKVNSVP